MGSFLQNKINGQSQMNLSPFNIVEMSPGDDSPFVCVLLVLFVCHIEGSAECSPFFRYNLRNITQIFHSACSAELYASAVCVCEHNACLLPTLKERDGCGE